MVSEFYWGDGSSDKLTITYSTTSGNTQLEIVSDENTSNVERSITILVRGRNNPQLLGRLTITQVPHNNNEPSENA